MPPILLVLFLQISAAFAVSCPGGGIYDNNFKRCYIYNSQPTVFLEAESTCRSIGGNLAEIRNGFENTAVAGFVNVMTNGSPPSTYWIGANLLLASKWTWTTNDTALFTNWAPDEPADPSNFDCGSVRSDTYLWKKELCYSARPFVCTAAAIPDPSDSPCDLGYTQYENQCYKLFNHFIDMMNFYDAKIFCREHENAHLPKITSAGVQDFLHGFIFDGNSDIWIGLMCWASHLADCEWWDYTVPTYSYFGSGQPVPPYPITMNLASGQWLAQVDSRQYISVVVCQKPARNV